MKRGETGRYGVTMVGGEPVRAFIPHSLPPAPPLLLDGVLPAVPDCMAALERFLLFRGLTLYPRPFIHV